MKKSYLLLIMLFVSIVAMGGPVTPDEARQKITKFMNPRRASAISESALQLVATSHYRVQKEAMAASYYVFNVGEGQGFVIAAADDRIPAVLGYSSKGKFDLQHMPENMKAWLQGYDDQMAYLNEHPEAAAPRKTVSGGSIAPLLQSEWDQGYPYYLLCPEDDGKHSVTGCVATAMAQVMYYWRWPKQTAAEIPGYTSYTKEFEMPAIAAGTSIDWDNMLPQYTGSETDAQKQAVAELMLLCGTAVQMNYSASGSFSYGEYVAHAWLQYLDYDAATTYTDRNKYRLAEWNQKVYDELKAGRPVYYDGLSSGGGHAFVIDGYDGDDYFHVNWGWGGWCNDGSFLLSILDSGSNSGIGASSSTDGYSFGQCAIFGAQPNTGVSPSVTPILTTQSVFLPDGSEFTRKDVNENFTFSVGFSYINNLNQTYTFDWGVGLFDTNGQLLGNTNYWYSELMPGYGFYDPSNYPFTITLGEGVTNNTFVLKPISRERNTETWYANHDSDIWNVVAVIDGNTLTLIGPKFDLTGSIEPTGKQEVKSPLNLTATITNNGTVFIGEIFLLVDGKLACGRHFDIDPEATENIDFSFIPDSEGLKTVELCTRSWNYNTESYDYNAFITDSVTVEAATAADLAITGTVTNATKRIVSESTIKFKATVQNNGLSAYDNNICAVIYMDGHDGYYYYLKDITKELQLGVGETTDINFEFDNLENENYIMTVSYISEGEWKLGYQSQSYTVKVEGEDPEVVKFTVQGIDVLGTQKTNEDLTITVNVKNEGNVQAGKLYLFVNNTLAKTFEVDITPNETKAYETTYKPTQAGDVTIKVTTDEAGETLAGAEAAATKTVTITDPEPVKVDPELAIKANEHFDSEQGFVATLGKPFSSPELINPYNVAPIVWTSSNPGVATVDENGIVTLLSIGETQIRADFAGNDNYNPGYAEYRLVVSDVIGYDIADDGTVNITGGDVTGDVVIGETVVINGQTYQVTGIGNNAFNGNTAITSVTIPDGINTIGAGAFDGCSQLTTIIIGKGVTTIGEKAFAHIARIPTNGPRRAESEGLLVKCYAENVPTTAADAFEGTPISSGTLLVEDNSVMAYYEATPWGQFGTVMGFNGTTGIERLVNGMGGGSVSVFALNGNKLAETQGAGLKQVLSTLPKGVYIIRVGNNSKTIHN